MSDEQEGFTLWHGLFLAEGSAIAIALLMPITPSKTGSDGGIADLLIPDPSYLQEVLVDFVFTNLLFVILGGIFVIWVKLRG